jgi:hypothetical protein
MPQVSPTGSAFEISREGYIVNPCRQRSIKPPWNDIVSAVREVYLQRFAQQIHSVYLRGSVPRGTAIEGVADLDSFGVLRRHAELPPAGWQEEPRARLLAAFPFMSDVELELFRFPDDSPRSRRLRFTIKTQSLSIAGEDLAPAIPPFRPGREAVMRAPLIGEQMQMVREALEAPAAADPAATRSLIGWLMRSVVRCGFELVMEAEKVYCRDLYPCFALFSKHYPQRARHMHRALEWAIQPPAQRETVLAFLDDFGSWLKEEVQVQLQLRHAG